MDAESGEPLKGAVVAVIWHKKAFLSMDGGWSFHNAKETLTDGEGKFSLDASEGINWNPLTFVQEPRIIIFYPGYRPLTPGYPGEFKDTYGIAEGLTRGAIVKLPKLTSNEEMRRFSSTSAFGLAPTPWEYIPNLMRLINVQSKLAGVDEYRRPNSGGGQKQ